MNYFKKDNKNYYHKKFNNKNNKHYYINKDKEINKQVIQVNKLLKKNNQLLYYLILKFIQIQFKFIGKIIIKIGKNKQQIIENIQKKLKNKNIYILLLNNYFHYKKTHGIKKI